jgi:hypothetical protein
MPFGRVHVARVPACTDGFHNRTTSRPGERSNCAGIGVGHRGHRAPVSRVGCVEARWLDTSLPFLRRTTPGEQDEAGQPACVHAGIVRRGARRRDGWEMYISRATYYAALRCGVVWYRASTPTIPEYNPIHRSTSLPSPSPLLPRREDKPLASTLPTRHIAPSRFANTSMSRQYLYLRLRGMCGGS